MFKDKNAVAQGLLIVLATAFLFAFYGKVFFNPIKYIFGGAGDGLKNYYTFSYHVAHDSSFTEMEGMNYPYGENVLYTDGHPLLSWICQILNVDKDYHVGILNFLMLISIWLNFLILFLLFKRLKVEPFLALAGALAIGFLQPQIFRLTGHYALSYAFAIPLAWYCYVRIKENPGVMKWVIITTLINVIWMFTHAYLGMIVLFFLGSFWFFDNVFDFKRFKLVKLLDLVRIVIVPILIFKLFSLASDVHIERTDNPMGFFDYFATFKEVLIPIMGPMKDFVVQLRGKDFNLNYEGSAYVGLWSLICLGFSFVIIVGQRILNKQWSIDLNNNRFVLIGFISTIPLLLFSFSWPFRGNPEWLDHVEVLKQFRATGRFAWAFYYGFTILAVVSLNQVLNLLTEGKFKFLLKAVPVLIIGLSLFESFSYHQHVSDRISATPNEFSTKSFDDKYEIALKQINVEDYQAILPLPYFHYGSENFHRPRQHEITKHSFVISQQSGLPMFGAFLTRVSIPESRNLVQLIGPVNYPKEVREDLESDKDILIIRSNETLTRHEKNLLPANPFYKNEWFSFYRIPVEALFEMNVNEKNFSDSFLSALYDRIGQNQWVSEDSSSYFYFNDFEDNGDSMLSFNGKGSFSFPKAGSNQIDVIPKDSLVKGESYTLSVWMYNKGQDVLNQWFDLRVRERYNVTGEWFETVVHPEMSEVIWGDWSLVELDFEKQVDNADLIIECRGRERSKATIYLDDLMIRKKDKSHYRFVQKDKLYFTGDNQWQIAPEVLNDAKKDE